MRKQLHTTSSRWLISSWAKVMMPWFGRDLLSRNSVTSVVARMVSAPSKPDYGRLSVMLQYRFDMEQIASVPATAFRPAPQVESAVVRMLPLREAPRAGDETLFAKLVRSAFMQRRKTLRNALRDSFTEEDFKALAIDPDARAQELSVSDYVTASNYLAKRPGDAVCA